MAELEGLSGVLRKLNDAIKQKELNLKAGLTEAVLVVKADSVRNTPIDLGNLRGSAFVIVTDNPPDNSSPTFTGPDSGDMSTGHSAALAEGQGLVSEGKKGAWSAIVAYSANYAFWVHEMPATYNFNSGVNKYLEKALLSNKNRIFQILTKWAKK